jgi:hypothetical protein
MNLVHDTGSRSTRRPPWVQLIVNASTADPADGTRGEVLPVIRPERVTVWLRGDVDLSLTHDLLAVSATLTRLRLPLVVDVSGLTFCDATVADFLSCAADLTSVSVRRPSRLMRDFLHVFGLADQVRITQR